MFQKSLQILIVGTLVALGIIVAYATLRLSGPADALAEAEARMARGDYANAVSVLNLAERGVSDRHDLRERLWRLRYAANSALDNAEGALIDVANLLQNGHRDDIELRLDQIRLLARAGDGERARRVARGFLEQQPEHSRALELAGEACQTIYQPQLRELREAIEREIARTERRRARLALLSFAYRPDGDPQVTRAEATLQRLFDTAPRLVSMWPAIRREAQSVRERVQEGIGYFQRSLDSGGEPVAAFRAIAVALEQSGRIDDLLLACEIQRRQFDHAYVDESGVIAAWAHLNADQPQAAIATAIRWLSPEQLEQRIAANSISPATEELLLTRAVAAWQLRDLRELNRVASDVAKLRQAGGTALLPLHITLATRRILRENRDPEAIETSLRAVANLTLGSPARFGRPDLAAEFVPLLLERLAARNAGEAEMLGTLEKWRDARPTQIEPQLRIADYLLTLGRTAAAFAALDAAADLDREHPDLFRIRLAAARRHFQDTDQDGPGLLAQCARRRELLPDVTAAIGFVLCAEAALSVPGDRSAQIAAACARSAVDAFPSANLPRRLEIAALLADSQMLAAARAADRTIRAIVPDTETLALVIQAKRAAGQSIRELVRASLPAVQTAPGLQAELLRIALADAPTTAWQFVTDELLQSDSPSEHRLAVSRAYSLSGQVDRAAALLDALPPDTIAGQPEATVLAFVAWLRAAATGTPDAELQSVALRRRDRLGVSSGPQLALLTAAKSLATTHPRTAAALFEDALRVAAPEERTGAYFALAGRWALHCGDARLAEQHWTAALGFADRGNAAEDLARLLIAREQLDRAAAVYQMVDTPTDPALAARFGHFYSATSLLSTLLPTEPADLLTHAILATFGQESMVDWQAAVDELQITRLELLACLRDPDVGALVLPRAQRLQQSDPSNGANRLLVARAALDAGQYQLASQIHAKLFTEGLRTPVIWHEMAYGGQRGGDDYVPDAAMWKMFITYVTGGGVADSPRAIAWGMQQVVSGFQKGGFAELAEQALLSQWLAIPRAQPWTVAELDLNAAKQSPRDACFIFDQILQGPHAGDRREVLTRFYRLAPAALAADPSTAGYLIEAATRHLHDDGALGPIVHFLLSPALAKQARKAIGRDASDLLVAHLTMIATGRDDTDLLDRTVDALLAVIGIEAVATEIDKLLDAYPTAVPLWAVRTLVQTRRTADHQALSELRTVLQHATDDRARLAFIGLAAAERSLLASDLAQLQRLPDALRDSPAGWFVQGLVALRQGRPDDASKLLATAQPQHDGAHLFARALAELQGSHPDGTQRAIECLEALVNGYPSSSFARNVGSFVRQLSPRADSADDSESNR